jgi:ring-1,2-phenylacetyl-CoA epoxidase subunit PaaE
VFYALPIQRVWNETQDAVAISFEVPPELKDVFSYKHGQYITLRTIIHGEQERRAYSLCSSPYADEPLTIAVKKLADGVMSSWLTENVHQGASLDVMAPMGNFTTPLDASNARHLLCVAGGSGITPILSILKSALLVEPMTSVTLVYANVSDASIMFADELSRLSQQHGPRLRVVHVVESDATGMATFRGRMNPELMSDVIAAHVSELHNVEAFLCGPEGLMNIARACLVGAGLPLSKVHQEYFSISTTSESAITMSESSTELVTRRVKIRLYGEDHEFDVQPDETFLSAAQRANLDPPYACQIGACCTCRAKLVTGSAIMDEREALSDDEMADGYILTCQAHPTSDGCFADYDQ